MGIINTRAGGVAALLLVASAFYASSAQAAIPPDRAMIAGLAGMYDGGQTELAAGLELRADGRFRYAMSYGAMDEEAEGSWTVERDRVLLTSTPVVPARIAFVSQRTMPTRQLSVKLEVPVGLSRQYFYVEGRMADGTTIDHQLDEDQSPLDLQAGARPTAITLVLRMFDVRSETVQLSGDEGCQITFRFEPHDLGKAAFSLTPLVRDANDLILERYDRMIRFRRTKR